MKIYNLIIFLTVFLSLYGGINYYIFIRGMQAFPKGTRFRKIFLIVFLLMSSSYIYGRFLEKITICKLSDLLIWTGAYWFGMMLYFLLAVIMLDIIRLISKIFSWYPENIKNNYQKIKHYGALLIAAIIVCVIIAGHFIARNPQVRSLEITIPKRGRTAKSMSMVLVTDIHLGTLIKNSRLEKLVSIINGLNPDLVLLGGDIVDEDLAPVIENNLGEILKQIKSRYGTYAVTGNHEYIGGVDAATGYMKEHGITVLRDRAILVANSLYLVGREDRSMHRFIGQQRKTLAEIMAGIDRSYPMILMDHQPFGLSRARENGFDLQLSGHTHDGQLWPVSYITGIIYELSSGYGKIGKTHYYVSSGFGTWGPPLRIGTVSEIVHLTIHFSKGESK